MAFSFVVCHVEMLVKEASGKTRSMPLMLDQGSDVAQRSPMSDEACVAVGMHLARPPRTSAARYHRLLRAIP